MRTEDNEKTSPAVTHSLDLCLYLEPFADFLVTPRRPDVKAADLLARGPHRQHLHLLPRHNHLELVGEVGEVKVAELPLELLLGRVQAVALCS